MRDIRHLKLPIIFMLAVIVFFIGLGFVIAGLGKLGPLPTTPPSQVFIPFVPSFVLGVGMVVFAVLSLLIHYNRRHAFAEHAPLPRHISKEGGRPRLLFVVLDGAADRPLDALKGKTPLEIAHMPALNSIATRGQMTNLRVIPRVAPESDEAVLALLGYDPRRYYTGRGVIEASGLDMDFKDGDLALRGNFAYVEGGKLIDGRAGGLTTNESKKLIEYLSKKIKLTADFELKAGVGYRFVLVIKARGKRLSDRVSNTHPGYMRHLERGALISVATAYDTPTLEACKPLDPFPESKLSADLVNDFVKQAAKLLAEHPLNAARKAQGKRPANHVLLRDASVKVPRLHDINVKYLKEWVILADMPAEIGIGKLAGMEVVRLPEPSGHDTADFSLRADETLAALKKADCVYVHLKGPDNFSHKKDSLGKVRILEAIDKNFFAPLAKKLDLSSTVLAVTCDHATSSESGAHTSDSVPLLVYAPGIPEDLLPFNEGAARARAQHRFIFGGHNVRATHLIADLMRLLRHVESTAGAKARVERARAVALGRAA